MWKGNNQIQEAQRVPCRINPRRNMPRHILIRLTRTKHKEKILKATRDSAIKKNTSESVLMRWMKLEPIIQSEVSQKEKHQYSILTHIYGI